MLPPLLLSRRHLAEPRTVDATEFRARRQVTGQPAVPYQVQLAQPQQYPPPRVPFACMQSQFCRTRKGMMIVVPGLAHRQQRGELDIASLYRGAVDNMMHAAMVVGEMTDQPVPRDSRRDPRAHAPDDEGPPAGKIQH